MSTTAERSGADDVTIKGIFMQHMAAYEYAKKFVSAKIVLDIGCGEGYGTGLLAGCADKVIGIDYSWHAIEEAVKSYKSGKTDFICSDIGRYEFKKESFDVICAFQVIEHLKKPDILMNKIKDILKKDGVLLLTTPNKKMSLVEHPYHYKEYTGRELEMVLKRYFGRVELLSLHFNENAASFREHRRSASHGLLRWDPLRLHRLLPRFIRRKIFDFVAEKLSRNIYKQDPSLVENIALSDFWFSKDDIDAGIDLLGVCIK